MPARRYTAEILADVARRYLDGESTPQIAAVYRATPATVNKWLRKTRTPLRTVADALELATPGPRPPGAGRPRTGTTEPCGTCGRAVYRPLSHGSKPRYCSNACANAKPRPPGRRRQPHQRPTTRCAHCGTPLRPQDQGRALLLGAMPERRAPPRTPPLDPGDPMTDPTGDQNMSPADLVQMFHERPGVDCVQPPSPTLVPGLDARAGYIDEEAQEFRDAVAAGDLVAAADALADLIYVVYGAAWQAAIPLDEVFKEVHRSNMTKIPTPGGGKAQKGPGYSPPDVAAVLARYAR